MNDTQAKPDVYLIHYNGVGALIKLNTRETSSERFGEIQRRFAVTAGAKGDEFADMFRLDSRQATENGILYRWELAGPDGAWYQLIQWPTTPPEYVETAKAEIRHKFDVVRLEVLRIGRLIDFNV